MRSYEDHNMIDINADNLEVWRGPFSWNGLLLRLHIRTVKLDYDAEDPRTWPLIKDVVQTEVNYDYRQTKPAPRFLAYEQSLMENLITHRLLVNKVSCRPNLHGKQIKVMFAYYPFNFDRYGEMRKSPHIPADELKEWIKLMKGTVLDAKYIQNTSTPSRPAPDRQVEAREGQTTDVAVTTEHVSKVLMSNNSLSDTALANIQDESKTMQRQLQTAIEATINTRITVHDKLLHAVTQKTRALELLINDQHQAALEHAKAADNNIMMLTEWVEKQKE